MPAPAPADDSRPPALMPRSPRLLIPGVPLHVVQRGNNRALTFRTTWDFQLYRETLLEASRRFNCAIHAYALMTNHVHLLVSSDDDTGVSRMMHAVGTRFVRRVNTRYGRTGTLWEGRFKSALIDSERYFFACTRYVELNPVRARLVHEPAEYDWSSHRHNAYGGRDALITPHPLYLALGALPARRHEAYRALFREPLEDSTLGAIRRATARGRVVGDEPFVEQIETTLERPLSRLAHGGDRRSSAFRASPVGFGASSVSRNLTP